LDGSNAMTVPMASPDVALDAGAALGESPVWDPAADQLLWVDCVDGSVHRFDPATGADVAVDTGRRVGSVAVRQRGGLVMAAGSGFAFLDEHTGAIETVAQVEPDPNANLMNDGACDVAGRFWAGTASTDERPTAGLYRFDTDSKVTRVVSEVRMSNGIGWSPDNRRMYYVDSGTQGLDVFEYHADEGTLGQRCRLVELHADLGGIPDGLAVDSEGCIWLALWGPGVVHRYTPHGVLDRAVSVPASHTTSCAFGGRTFDVLYITSARIGLTEQQRREQPHAGAVFAMTLGVPGLPSYGYAG
jgi:sugar lactone lactonase YvrE